MSHPPPPPPPPPPYGGAPGFPGGYGGAVPGDNKKALWSLIAGILGIICCSPAAIAALVLGFNARAEISRSAGTQTGDGQAIAGIVLGFLGCLLLVVQIVLVGTGALDLSSTP